MIRVSSGNKGKTNEETKNYPPPKKKTKRKKSKQKNNKKIRKQTNKTNQPKLKLVLPAVLVIF